MHKKTNIKVIRFRKKGHYKYNVYDIVVTYKYKRYKANFIEKLGFFNPNINERCFFIDTERLSFWLNKGVLLNASLKRTLSKFSIN